MGSGRDRDEFHVILQIILFIETRVAFDNVATRPIYLIIILMKKKFSERRIYLNPDNCDDCVLKQLEQADLDTCGGRKVADGSEEDGTMYRYIASGIFIYFWLNFHFRFKVFSHTIFNATVVTFRSHKDDQTVVIGQPSE